MGKKHGQNDTPSRRHGDTPETGTKPPARASKKAKLKQAEAASVARMRKYLAEERRRRALAFAMVSKEGREIDKRKRANEEARRRLNRELRSKPASYWQRAKLNLQDAAFEELRSVWLSAVLHVARLGTGNAHVSSRAPEEVIRKIEAEWKRRTDDEVNAPFDWPNTSADHGSERLTSFEWQPSGMLAYLGYHVGRGSEISAAERQALLTRIYEVSLPPLNDRDYLHGWGPPGTGKRLRKMADSIAAFTRNARRRNSASWDIAIGQWEEDLQYLENTFYRGRFDFKWPHTK